MEPVIYVRHCFSKMKYKSTPVTSSHGGITKNVLSPQKITFVPMIIHFLLIVGGPD
jgi:hypothetical protein